ncbi:NFX1-type zinc finger-containing protein 1 isoform X1 [Nematostella vectensis]|uniref:NFX1-type zinc finger-containing protein 1 isoform X1 n=1 Tax=Nematostella vectensis TaxID=45351 RepID=UPI0020776336|nr:NFX1-type zinc finger-containing protein 1 isoform X1 [Nematostella vectensis]
MWRGSRGPESGYRASRSRGNHNNASRGNHNNASRGNHNNASRGNHNNASRGNHNNASRGNLSNPTRGNRSNQSRGGQSQNSFRGGACYRDDRYSNHYVSDNRREVKLGYNALSQMLSVEPDNIVIDLTSERVTSATEELLEAKEMRDDLFLLVLKVLSRACKSAARSSLLRLLNLVQASRFLTVHLSAYLNSHWGKSHMEWEGVLEALQNTVVLFSEMLIRLPSCYVYLPIPSLQKCTSILVASGKIQNNGIEAAVEELVMLMREKSEELRRNADLHRGNRRGYNSDGASDDSAPPEDFRQISVIPTQDDICRTDTPFLRKNKATGGFSNPEHYLDVQFRLMREDFIRPLRQGIQDLLLQWDAKKKKMQDIRVYHNARLLFPVFSEKGISYKVSFDVSSLKRVNWKNSKRLIYGSLLCLSKDNFESFILATVENRDDIELEEGLIDISFHNHAAHGINLTDDLYEMVETTAYFESYRHVLEGLKEIDPQSMPFQRYIVRCESEVDAPAYLRNRMMEKITYDFAPILDKRYQKMRQLRTFKEVSILDTNSWPNAHVLNLDESQLRAVQTALTKEFAVIQGPPGTGKTYIGLKVAKVLLHNKEKWDSGTEQHDDEGVEGEQLQMIRENHQAEVRHRPILVVCFTNHALDQFLEGIHEFHPENIVRVGGRCKSEVLSKCNLKEIRRDLGKGDRVIRRRYWEVKEEQDMVSKIVDSATENLRRCTEELIHEDELVKHGQISTRQKESIRKDHMSSSVSAMPYWLEVMPLLAQEPLNVPPVGIFPLCEAAGKWNMANENGKPEAYFSQRTKYGPGVDGRPSGSVEILGSRDSFVAIQNGRQWMLDIEESISIAFYVFPNNSLGGPIVSYDGSASDRFGVEISQKEMIADKGVLSARFSSRILDTLEVSLSYPVLKINAWNYVVATYSSNTGLARLWHDGKVVGEALIGEYRQLATQYPLRVGSLSHHGDRPVFKGRVAGLYIFPEAIGKDQIWRIAGITQEDIDEANDEAEDFSYEADAMMEARKIDDDDDDDDYDYEARRKRLKNQRLIEIKVADTSEWKTVRGKNSRKRHDGAVRKRMNSNDVMTQKEAEAMEEADLWAIPLDERWRLYRYWISNLRRQYKETVIMHQDEYVEVSQRLNEARRIEDISILRKAAVIGMTTTGAAKYREVLQEIKPRIIIVEEAAEVLEAHIVTALSPGCQHLILIGDHEQLRPNPTVYKLAKDYHLDISLFERVVNNKMHLECLRKQHRMRPEISQMLQHIYPDLENHESVLNFDNIKGVSTNIFFIDHQEREEFIEEGRSRSNIHEAKFVAALCRYLILQGYERSKITVLTMYTGQLLQLKKEMPKDFFNGVRVSAVDNFQGEENDIILLSLVRSNDDGNIGFLRISNRVCVALSRARKGFYCIGNMGLMEEKEELWKKILDDLRQKKKVGQNLVLACQNHPKTLIHASKDSDFKAAPEGGCMVPCATRLECGHVCEKVCHPGDPDHVEYECRKPCPKKLCDLGHDCPRRCFQKCEPCKVLIAKVIPKCQHEQQIPCHVEPEKFKCQEPCPKTLKCGHQCAAKCGDDCTKECMVMIEETLPCGHKHTLKCHVDPTTVKCRIPCNAKLKCLHTCAGNCNSCLQQRVHEQCKSKCDRTLFCGHSCQEPCTKNCPPCQKQCENKCKHSKCKNRCGEPCVPCAEPCAWECRHYKCNKLCGEMCDRPRCDKPCLYKIKCKHPCIGLCGEKCPKKCRICDKDEVTAILFGNEDEQGARFIQLEDCPHIVEVKAMDEWMDKVEDTTFVQLKKCPICTVPIRNTRRYGNIVKRVLRDFETIKGKVALSLREIQPEVRRLGEELRNVRRLSDDHPSFLDTDWNKKLENNLKTSKLTVNQLNVFENQINFLRRLLELACSTSKAFRADSLNRLQSGKTLKKQVRPLERHIIADRSWISEQELEDIDEEIRRLELWLSRKILKHQLEKRRKSLLREDNACIYLIHKALKSGERIAPSERKDFMDWLDELRKQYLPDVFYESVTNDEKREIVKAVGLAKGHWYKCPNGHFYCIGECGGATQESNCPECGSRIGGTGHRLLEDNSLAPEMDGAQYSAYGDMANMNNFDLDRIDMD